MLEAGEDRKPLSAVWIYFLLAATMVAGQQLAPYNEQETNSSSYDQTQHKILEIWKVQPSPSTEEWAQYDLYAAWGPWSPCRTHSCTQTRVKHCRRDVPTSVCAGAILKEERPCPKSHVWQQRHCNKKRRRKHRHKKRKPPFHVVVNKSGKSLQRVGARSGDFLVRRGEGEEDSDLGTDNEVSLRGEYKRAYSRWSRWTICTKSCTTQRYRWCKRPAVCGKDVIRETAFCYQEGSRCHTIHKNMMRRGTDDNSIYNDKDLSGGPGYDIPPFPVNPRVVQGHCGQTSNRTGRTGYMSNMLRIIGGRPTQHGKWPWQVAVLNRFKEAFCGGTLIAAQWVLTAAHCVRRRLYVRLGEHDLAVKEGTELEIRVEYAVTHPQYDVDTVDNDLALLHLPSPVQTDDPFGVVCLPRARQPLPTHRPCTIIGWGKRRASDMFGTDILQEAQVPIVSNEECRRVYEDYRITGNMFCAGHRRGRTDSCAGDSGGPLLCRDSSSRWTIFGITSFGEGCGKRGKYGIYTRLPNYVKWVHRVMKAYTTV